MSKSFQHALLLSIFLSSTFALQAANVTIDDKTGTKCLESGCSSFCATIVDTDLDTLRIPGYILSNQQSNMIARVLPGSPADLAGIRPGDSLIELDGAEAGIGLTVASKWQDAKVHVLLLRRNGRDSKVELRSATISSILRARAWSGDGRLQAVDFIQAPSSSLRVYSYMSGLELDIRDDGRLLVSAVVTGSPAERSGIMPGDLVSSSDHSFNSPARVRRDMEGADASRSVVAVVQRPGKAAKQVQLKFVPVYELLSSPRPPEHGNELVAMR